MYGEDTTITARARSCLSGNRHRRRQLLGHGRRRGGSRRLDSRGERPGGGLLGLGGAVEEAEVGLPADGDDAGEDAAELERDEGEAEGGDGGPELERVDHAGGHRLLDALDGLGGRVARQQRLHAEEVAVEDGREADLVDGDLGEDGQHLGRVVEAVG